MTEKELSVFINSVHSFFIKITNEKCETGMPYIKKEEKIISDYTGIIGISGRQKGGICISADEKMLTELTSLILESDEVSTEEIVGTVGELANTIAGNAGENFGSSFMISVPFIIKGSTDEVIMKLIPPVFVIPILWRSYKIHLLVGLE